MKQPYEAATPADRLEALHRVAEAARAWKMGRDGDEARNLTVALELAVVDLDEVECKLGFRRPA